GCTSGSLRSRNSTGSRPQAIAISWLGLAYVQDRPLDSRSADPAPSLPWAGPVTAEPPKGVAL
ncbi:hypothetical protein ABZ554_46540, partial [Streptomyces sp. NPDC020125]|uniref:hypothetical protein n=1 Tax=Streptomyces sp. NPDC020125 TaxID=3154593 RepID=UPI0033FF3BB4